MRVHGYDTGSAVRRRLILVRHCEATGQSPDARLTPAGLQQAEQIRDFLADEPIDLVVSSEFLRARQSAGPLALSKGLRPEIDHRWNERAISAEPVENWRQILRDSFTDYDLSGPGGESARAALGRVWSAIDELWARDCRLPVAVTHGNLVSLALHSVDGAFGYEGWEGLTNPDVYLLERMPDGRLRYRRMWV